MKELKLWWKYLELLPKAMFVLLAASVVLGAISTGWFTDPTEDTIGGGAPPIPVLGQLALCCIAVGAVLFLIMLIQCAQSSRRTSRLRQHDATRRAQMRRG